MKHENLITDLSQDLKPVAKATNPALQALGWGLGSAVFVVLITAAFGALRPTALGQLASSPRFLLETLSGIVAIGWLAAAAFYSAIPGALNRWVLAVGFGLLVLWLSHYVFGIQHPTLEPSMLGKRHFCFYETFGYAIFPATIGVFLVFRLYPVRPVTTAILVGLTAGMIPALYMQLACMYEPVHILQFHILPGFLAVGVALVVMMSIRAYRR